MINSQVQNLYENYLYHHICKLVMNFLTNTVSPVYCHLIKDKLYCDEVESPTRLAAMEVTCEILTVLTRSIAPIVPHLAEEVWLYHPENLGKQFSQKVNKAHFLSSTYHLHTQHQCHCIILNLKYQKFGISQKSLST